MMLPSLQRPSCVLDGLDCRIFWNADRGERAMNFFQPGGRKLGVFRPIRMFEGPPEPAMTGEQAGRRRRGIGPEINGPPPATPRVHGTLRPAGRPTLRSAR